MNSFFSRIRAIWKRHAFLVLFILFVALLSTGYALGYRPGAGFTFVRTGTLVLTGLPTGATVYADETKRATAKSGDVRLSLVPGSHTIIVDAAGNNPWNELVNIDSQAETSVAPLIVPLKVTRTFIPEADRAAAEAKIAGYALPSDQHPLVMAGGCANVMVSENRIVAAAATTTGCVPPPYLCVGGTCATTVVFCTRATQHYVLPFPGRNDTLIVAYGDTLAVLELNPLKPQFFAPLIQGGVAPVAAPYDDKHIVVHDDTSTFEIGF
jgi:hypothetical protein